MAVTPCRPLDGSNCLITHRFLIKKIVISNVDLCSNHHLWPEVKFDIKKCTSQYCTKSSIYGSIAEQHSKHLSVPRLSTSISSIHYWIIINKITDCYEFLSSRSAAAIYSWKLSAVGALSAAALISTLNFCGKAIEKKLQFYFVI